MILPPKRKDYAKLTRKKLINLRQEVMFAIMNYENKHILCTVDFNPPSTLVDSTINEEAMYYWNNLLLELLSKLIEEKRLKETLPSLYKKKSKTDNKKT